MNSILYCSDVQGDLEALKSFRDVAEKTKPSAVVVAGNLIDGVFSEEQAEAYMGTFQGLNAVKDSLKTALNAHVQSDESIKKLISPDFFGRIMNDTAGSFHIAALTNNPAVPIDVRNILNQYLELLKPYQEFIKTGEASMKEQYGKIKDIMSGVEFLTLPGNHDGVCLEDILGKENLHKRSRSVDGIKFTGYGTANLAPTIMPPKLRIPYSEGEDIVGPEALAADPSTGVIEKMSLEDEKGKLVAAKIRFSEPYKIFKAAKPQVAVAYNPPNGLYPFINTEANGFARYISEEHPPLVLVGRATDALGVAKSGKSYVVNPGSLNCKDRNGTYCEIVLAKEGDSVRVDGVRVHKVKGNELVGAYKMNGDGEPVFESDFVFPIVHTFRVN